MVAGWEAGLAWRGVPPAQAGVGGVNAHYALYSIILLTLARCLLPYQGS